MEVLQHIVNIIFLSILGFYIIAYFNNLVEIHLGEYQTFKLFIFTLFIILNILILLELKAFNVI